MEPMQHHNSSQSAGSKQQPSSLPARVPAPPSLLPAVLHRLGLNRETLPVEQLSAALAHPDWSVRASAIHQLENMEKRIAIPLLQSVLQDEHAAVRATAVSMMGKLGEYAFLLESLGDSDWQVREAAVLALGTPGTHAPIEPLLAAQHDPDAAVREAAQYTLRTHSTRAFPLTDSRAQQPIDGEMDLRQALSFQATEWQAQRESENGLTNEHVVLASGQNKQIIAHIGGTKHMKEVMTPEQMPTRRFAPEEGRTTPARRTPRFKFTPLWRTLSICAAIVVVVVNIVAWGILTHLTQLHHGQPGSQTGTATVQAGKRLYTYSFGKGKALSDLAWSPDGKHMAAAIGEIAHGTVHIWDATTGGHEVIYTPSPSSNQHVDSEVYATSVAWSPDGKRLASAIGDVQVWDVATGRILTRYFPPLSSGLGTVNTIAWSPDGKYLAGAFASWNTNGICIWDTRTGNLVHMFQSNNEMPSRAWSPNGKYLLTIGNAVEVWSMPTGQLVSTHTQHNVQNAAWSPDSTRIASAGSDGTVQIWDALTGHGLVTYTGHVNQGAAGVEALAWSPDGKRLVSSGSDIQVWNAATGKLIFVYTGQHSSKGSPYLHPLAWSPNGKLIASGERQPRDAGGNIQVWEAA